MNRKTLVLLAALALGIGAAVWMRTGAETPAAGAAAGNGALVAVNVPAAFSEAAGTGEAAFNGTWAACHCAYGAGTEAGPPLVHRIYEPSHHGDYAFEMAVANGVRAHHWQFGDMPPQPGLTDADVRNIVAYVRELQRANGIE